jgi:hypothetical protein
VPTVTLGAPLMSTATLGGLLVSTATLGGPLAETGSIGGPSVSTSYVGSPLDDVCTDEDDSVLAEGVLNDDRSVQLFALPGSVGKSFESFHLATNIFVLTCQIGSRPNA